MINLTLNNSRSKEFYKLINTSHKNYIKLSAKLQIEINAKMIVNTVDPEIEVLRYIKKKLRKIIIAAPKEMEIIIEDFRNKGYQDMIYDNLGSGKLTNLGKLIKKTFNYKSFRQSSKAKLLSKELNIKSCTTCNTQYTLTTPKKSLYHFDHFYPQSVFPYLSLSYYNLLPCCANCNMGKSNKVFSLDKNIHPYEENFHRIAHFIVDKNSLTKFLIDPKKNEDLINYELGLRAKYFANPIYEKKLENYKSEYSLDSQYEHFKDVAAEIYLKSRYYHKFKRQELRKFFEDENINLSEQQIKRFIVGNYIDEKDLLKRPLAKFMKDISHDVQLF